MLPAWFEQHTQQQAKNQGERDHHPGIFGSLLAEATWNLICYLLDFRIVLAQSLSDFFVKGLYWASYHFLCIV